jgi:hypothetical protein
VDRHVNPCMLNSVDMAFEQYGHIFGALLLHIPSFTSTKGPEYSTFANDV